MKLQVGRTYFTRTGIRVNIVEYRPQGMLKDFPFIGVMDTISNRQFWKEDGSFLRVNEDDRDLVLCLDEIEETRLIEVEL